MTDKVNTVVFTGFNNCGQVLKAISDIPSADRFFEGVLSAQVIDKQGEVTITDELLKVLPIWMASGAPISDTHSNRIVGQGINFAKTVIKTPEGKEVPAIKIIGKIHNRGYELDNAIWNAIKSGDYKGLSFGGATRSGRVPVTIDGKMAYALKDLEQYEVAVCKDPAVPLAIITEFNALAKAMPEQSKDVQKTDLSNGMVKLHCDKVACYVEKAENTAILNSESNIKNSVMTDVSKVDSKKILKDDEEEDSKTDNDNTDTGASDSSASDSGASDMGDVGKSKAKPAVDALKSRGAQQQVSGVNKAFEKRIKALEDNVEVIAKSTLAILEKLDSKKALDSGTENVMPATSAGQGVKIPNKQYEGQSNQKPNGAAEAESDAADLDNTGSDVVGKASRQVTKTATPRSGVVDAPAPVIKDARASARGVKGASGNPILDEIRKSGDMSGVANKILFDSEFQQSMLRRGSPSGKADYAAVTGGVQ